MGRSRSNWKAPPSLQDHHKSTRTVLRCTVGAVDFARVSLPVMQQGRRPLTRSLATGCARRRCLATISIPVLCCSGAILPMRARSLMRWARPRFRAPPFPGYIRRLCRRLGKLSSRPVGREGSTGAGYAGQPSGNWISSTYMSTIPACWRSCCASPTRTISVVAQGLETRQFGPTGPKLEAEPFEVAWLFVGLQYNL